MAQETPALKVIALGTEDDRATTEVDDSKPRRNPLLRYDEMFVRYLAMQIER